MGIYFRILKSPLVHSAMGSVSSPIRIRSNDRTLEDALTGIRPRLPLFWTFFFTPRNQKYTMLSQIGALDRTHQSENSNPWHTATVKPSEVTEVAQQTYRTSEEDSLRSETFKSLAHYLVTRSDETQRGDGDRPTDLPHF